MRPGQLNLFNKPDHKARREHGGSVRTGKRKLARPIATDRPLHLVLRSTKARGAWSFLHKRHKGRVHLLLLDTAARFGVKIYRFENVGNHLHLLVQGRTRRELRAFFRVFPQRLMFVVTGCCKGNPVGRFFDRILYSRVVSWGREFKTLQSYHWKNALESLGIDRQERDEWRRAAAAVPL